MDAGRHVCIWFDDGGEGLELLCACGARAVAVVDEVTGDTVLVALAAEPVRVMAATA
ncbi:MAG TPA: hypothetical protein VGC57_02745 [Cellulomonas sp.]